MLQVLLFECRYQLRSPLFLVLAAVFFLLAFFLTASSGVSLGGVGNNLNFNASWTIVYTQFFFSIIGMFAAIAIVSQAITRDYEFKTAELIFVTGISQRSFLLGRFFGAGLFGVLVGVAALLGTMVGTFMPWLDQERIGDFTIAPYVYALLVVTLPNIFFSSALFFGVAALTRSMLAAFVGAVGFIVLYIIVSNLVDPEKIELLAMFGPFGQVAFGEVSRYWTVFERNIELVPLTGSFLINRVLWTTVGVVALGLTAWRYRFSVNTSSFKRRSPNKNVIESVPEISNRHVPPVFDWRTPGRQFVSQMRIDLGAIYKSIPFYAVLAFALLNVWGSFSLATPNFGAPLLPTTSGLLRSINSSYTFFILLIVIYYAGEIVHRERSVGVSDVLDATPFANGVMVASKIVSMWFVIACLLAVGMLAAILSQVIDGYTHFQLGLYLQSLFLIQGGFFFLLAVLAVFLQVLLANKWLGMVAVLATFIFFNALPSWDFQHGLYLFTRPPAPHSDMNGYGHYLLPFMAFTVYWALFCTLLALCAHVLYERGRVAGFKARFGLARSRMSPPVRWSGAVTLVAFVSLGAWIYYNTNVLNQYKTTEQVEALQASYEKTFKHFELKAKPEVLSVDSVVDLFPYQRRLESTGSAKLSNETNEPLHDLLVSTHPFILVNKLTVEGASLVEDGAEYGAHVYRFEPPLAPGDHANMVWDLTWRHDGFANINEAAVTGGASNRVVANGTFVNNTEIMPIIGYNAGGELQDPQTRRDNDLEPIVRLPRMGDPDWLGISQFGVSQRTDFRTVFSTSSDQIAVAPGYQVGEVEERDGRRYYTYEMDAPIWPFFSFVSARYEVAKDVHAGVNIEVYYDKQHDFNIDSMLRGTKKALDYFNQEFSPYQYRQFRILEFPRYASFAQSFPNTIPFSESIGFVVDLRDEHALDMAFYVTAHELAHQWWAHQVVGANMQGMTVLVETLAQYSALMVMEKEYGADKMRRFLRYELDRYLSGRGGELIEELPLVLVENQQYIHYQKGSLVMYALQDAIGEAQVNLALRKFIDKFAFASAPFPTAAQLVDEFRAVASEEHQDLITDLFENITLYDMAVTDADAVKKGDEWEVTLTTHAAKFYADGRGEEREAPLAAWIDIAVFPQADEELEDYQLPEPLFFERRLIKTGNEKIVVRVVGKPHRVGIDPYNKMVDRNPEDNLKFVTEN